MSTEWKSYAELVGLTAVVASLVFVGLELQQSHAIAEAEMHANDLGNTLDVRNAKIANAEIWIKGNAGEELTTVEEVIYAQLVYMTNDRFWYAVQEQRRLGLEKVDGLDVAEFASFLHENPKARRLWRFREERLAKYRGMIRPYEEVTSNWMTQVEAAIAVFEREEDSEK